MALYKNTKGLRVSTIVNSYWIDFKKIEGEKISALLTRSWKKSFDSGVIIPTKMRFCNECNDKKKRAINVIIKSTKIKNSKLI